MALVLISIRNKIEKIRFNIKLNKYNINYANLYHLFGNSLEDRNLADINNLEDNKKDLSTVTNFCVEANIPSIFILPGVTNPGQSRNDALKNSINWEKAFSDLPTGDPAGTESVHRRAVRGA